MLDQTYLYGKRLPFVFAKGYLTSLWLWNSYSNIISYYVPALQARISSPDEQAEWLEPFTQYLNKDLKEAEDLDYAYTSLIVEGYYRLYTILAPMSGIAEKQTRSLLRTWCFSNPPAIQETWRCSLQDLYDVQLRVHIREAISSDQLDGSKARDRSTQAFLYLINRFCSEAKISCEQTIRSNQLIYTFPECPFCIGRIERCVAFPELLQAFLDWIQGSSGGAFPHCLQINRELGSDHRVVIDIR